MSKVGTTHSLIKRPTNGIFLPFLFCKMQPFYPSLSPPSSEKRLKKKREWAKSELLIAWSKGQQKAQPSRYVLLFFPFQDIKEQCKKWRWRIIFASVLFWKMYVFFPLQESLKQEFSCMSFIFFPPFLKKVIPPQQQLTIKKREWAKSELLIA